VANGSRAIRNFYQRRGSKKNREQVKLEKYVFLKIVKKVKKSKGILRGARLFQALWRLAEGFFYWNYFKKKNAF